MGKIGNCDELHGESVVLKRSNFFVHQCHISPELRGRDDIPLLLEGKKEF
jgi:hypothetical protein